MNGNVTAQPLDRQQIETAVALATQSPSLFNSQPWEFRSDGTAVTLNVATARTPSGVDPTGREVLISCGAALFNLRLGLAAVGREPIVHVLPEPSNPAVVATVRIGGPHAKTSIEDRLIAAIPERRTSRAPFERHDVPYEILAHLMAGAEAEGAFLDVATGEHTGTLLRTLSEADAALRHQVGAVTETVRWVFDSHGSGAGIPREALGPESDERTGAVRDFALGIAIEGRPATHFEDDPLLAVLSTHGDAPVNWVRAGMALQRICLEATARGVSVGILSQAGEVPELRDDMRDRTSGWGHPHLVLRLGYGPDVLPTPRLPLREVLEVAAQA